MGKKITIEFRDELEENTTYVIDFSNAIEDNNESNQLDGYTFAFSTGEEIDTLAVSGIVLRAKDLEPMQHVIVGLHSNFDDSAFTCLPLERVSRTNDKGKFTIHEDEKDSLEAIHPAFRNQVGYVNINNGILSYV